MAIKTFATGEVLTASDTNTYLANAGLVYVTSTTFSASTVSVNNCFTSTYKNYKVIIKASSASALYGYVRMRVGGVDASGSGYAWGRWYYGTASGNGGGYGTTYAHVAEIGSLGSYNVLEFFNPQAAADTHILSHSTQFDNGSFYGITHSGLHNVSTSYDGFTLFGNVSQTITGELWVYGYRNA